MAIAITLLGILGYFGIALGTARLFVWSLTRGGRCPDGEDVGWSAIGGLFWPVVLGGFTLYQAWRGVVRLIAPEIGREKKRLKQATDLLDAAKDLAKVAKDLEPDDPLCAMFFEQVTEMTTKAVELGAKRGCVYAYETVYEVGNYGHPEWREWRINTRKAPSSKRRTVPEGAGLTVQEKRDLMRSFL